MTSSTPWYKDAIIYQLHVKAFFDSTNDGIGDFTGLIQKLDYLQSLGVTALWLLPFYPSPLRDDGYDIADYYDVNPAYGTLEDCQRFIDEAHKRGLKVITELVINHTSDQHPWFQRARNAPQGSPERDYYVWSDTDKKYAGTRIIFSDTELSNWTWDPVAKQYYWHRFFSHQPDLNFDNPAVLDEVLKAMYFWLDKGVDGLRLDAVPYLCEREGTNNENLAETHAVIKKIRSAIDARYTDRLLLAEANQWPEDVQAYFGNGDECHMAFHFPLMPRLYMALAQEDRHPVTDILNQTPEIPENCQWAMFLRNHDELTLEMVTDRERDYLWNFYASDRRARINFGIRRRLAPLMDNDRRKIELLNALLMSMPGTPIIYYGDEIGMGDNIYLGDRNGVRTPMQWSSDRNAGFSRADPGALYLPVIMDQVYGFTGTNVEMQARVKNSLLNWMHKLIATAKNTRVFRSSNLQFLNPTNRKIIAYLRADGDICMLCVANLSGAAQAAELDLKQFKGRVPVEMLSRNPFPEIGEEPYMLTFAPYGFYWFEIGLKKEQPDEVIDFLPEWRTVVIPGGWQSMFTGRGRKDMESVILPEFLLTRRWYKGRDAGFPTVRIIEAFPFGPGYLVLIEAAANGKPVGNFTLLLNIAWESAERDIYARLRKDIMARARHGAKVGVLYEAFNDAEFLQAAFAQTRFAPKPDAPITISAQLDPQLPVKPLGADQSNSSALIGEKLIFKFFRQPYEGINPDEEINAFLTQKANFPRTPAVRGAMALQTADNRHFTAGMLQDAITNQGDGWVVTQNYLQRLMEAFPATEEKTTEAAAYQILAEQLGRRTAELHDALASNTTDPDFAPEPVTAEDRAHWITRLDNAAAEARQKLEAVLVRLPLHLCPDAKKMLHEWDIIGDKIKACLPQNIKTPKIRVHGDYHLGQVLVSDNDFYIIDFEGEPDRDVADRRRKTLPFKDVAGMLRSFHYATNAAMEKANEKYDRKLLSQWLNRWRAHAEESFLKGYREAIHAHDTPENQNNLIRFFLIEKALYEISYEAQHRPTWVCLPVMGLASLLEVDR